MGKTALWRWFGALAVLVVVIQFVPYGRTRTNSAVRQEPAWDSAASRGLASQT